MNFADVTYRYPARFMVVDGLRVAYVDVNPEGGDPILFLHDVAGDLDQFAPAYERLASGRRVLGLDLIGFGKSDKPRVEDSAALNARLVGDLLSALDVERASLVGHGLGALVAARFAAESPDRVERVVLSALPGWRELTDEERATALDRFSFDRLQRSTSAQRRAWFEALVAGWNERLEAHVRLHDELARSIQFRLWAHAVEDAAASLLRAPARDVLGRVRAPALVVWGTDDPVAPFADAEAVCDALAEARLVPVERCGHLPALERPDAYFDPIVEFLSSGRARTAPLAPLAARSTLDLEPWPGLSPEIGRLARALFEQRDLCVRLTAGLSIEDVAWRPPPGGDSVGALLLHMGATTIWYLYEVLRGEPVPEDLLAKYRLDPASPGAPNEAPRKSAGRLVAEVELAHARLLEWLKPRTDADLNRVFTARDGSVTATLRWTLWHLVENALHHRGQIAYVKQLLPER